jgi:hypothetical protein
VPKLAVFVACEKALIDQDNNNVSLITLLQDVKAQVPQSADNENEYQQRIALIDPSADRSI